MNTKNNIEIDDMINLKELFFSIMGQWRLIILCIILSLMGALIYLRITPNIYSVNALVQVEEKKGTSAALLGDLSDMVEQKQPAQAEIEILKSRLILGNVIQHLHLDLTIRCSKTSVIDRLIAQHKYETEYQEKSVIFKDGEQYLNIQNFDIPTYYLDKPLELRFNGNNFSLTDLSTKTEILKAPINQTNKISTPYGEWNLSLFTPDQLQDVYIITKSSIPQAVGNILANYSVAEVGKMTGILSLKYQGQNKEHITKVLNEILVAYNQQNIERRSAETAQTLKFLDEQLPKLLNELNNAELKFNEFREKNNTIDVKIESELYLSQSIQLDTKKSELEQKVAEASAKYSNEHPIMQQMHAQLTAINQKISELNNILKQLPDIQRRYLQLFREVEVKQQLYTALLNSSQQLAIAKAGEIGNVRIIDTAVEPVAPIKPSKLTILILALFVGGFIGVIIALLKKMLHNGIRDASQIENGLDLPVYATVPRSPIQQNRIKLLKKNKTIPILAVKDNADIAIESLRSMRTAIYFALSSAKNNIIMISGPAPEVGKSFTSTNLAAILAQSENRVLIIDADMRRGNLDKYFNQVNQPGLSDFLNDKNSIEDIIKTTEVKNLHIITRGKNPNNPSELLSSEKFKNLLTHFSKIYDYIIIDTPPVLAVTDGIIISQYVGVNILVARFEKTQMKELEIAVNRFNQVGISVTGIILNDIRISMIGYDYNYTYSYKVK